MTTIPTPPQLRSDLPPLPTRLQGRPVDFRGFPVPWFLVDQDAVARANGWRWDFRIVHPLRPLRAHKSNSCWICGQPLSAVRHFVIGPMCAVNRVSAEPPCHEECAEFSAKACPFLANPSAVRRGADLPKELLQTPGIMIDRNPGAVIIWATHRLKVRVHRERCGVPMRGSQKFWRWPEPLP